jgi:hypothetical protein
VKTDGLHELAEERSLALHRAIVARLRDDPSLVDRAQERVKEWQQQGSVAAPYVSAWQELLATDLQTLCERLVSPDEAARALRQVTPFAGVVEARTRWRIWREVRADWTRNHAPG